MLAAAADTSFSLAPGPIVIVPVLTIGYVRRWRQVRANGSTRGAEVGRLLAWLGGVLCLAAALISPIDTLADQAFFMHMIQHVLLLDFAPILLIAGLSKVLLRPVARQVLDLERALGPIAHPVFAIGLYVGFMWLWHIPFMYDAALSHSAVHVLEHTCFISAGVLYWWHLLSPVRGRHLTGLAPVAYMASTKVLVGLLGVFLTFAPSLDLQLLRGPSADLGPAPVRRPSARRGDHGDRAVDRDGRRARLPVRAGAQRVRAPAAARGPHR